MKRIFTSSLAAIALVLVGAGCTPSSPSQPANANANASQPPSQAGTPSGATGQASAKADVAIQDFSFSPQNVNVKTGMTVVWTNNDAAAHTVTADSGNGPSSGTLNPGDTYAYTFTAPGTYPYHCAIHASMHGTVTVSD